MRTNKIIYWMATGLMGTLFLASAMMYLFNYPSVEKFFLSLGFPIWIIYPLAILKIMGVIVILTKRFNFLKELAYAGFLYDAVLALSAHIMVKDGAYMPAIVALVLLLISWKYDRKVFGEYSQEILHISIAKKNKLIYWITTGLICFMFTMGGLMYLFNYDLARKFFLSLGFPIWIIYPLAVLKFLGVAVVLTRKSLFLKELAYAGFLFDAILAVTAHIVVGDGQFLHGSIVIIATLISWRYDRKIFGAYIQKKRCGKNMLQPKLPVNH